jgi:hypothetical protein
MCRLNWKHSGNQDWKTSHAVQRVPLFDWLTSAADIMLYRLKAAGCWEYIMKQKLYVLWNFEITTGDTTCH